MKDVRWSFDASTCDTRINSIVSYLFQKINNKNMSVVENYCIWCLDNIPWKTIMNLVHH